MLAPFQLPATYDSWNRQRAAPFGRRFPMRVFDALGGGRNPLIRRYKGPFAWQGNSTIRRFEYPWVFDQIQQIGQGLTIADIGAGIAGMQFELSRTGYDVIAVDPALAVKDASDWTVDPKFHKKLVETFKAPVRLQPTTISQAGLDDDSIDVIMSVSTIEHFTPADLHEFTKEVRRVLKPGGHLVLTVDLFIDVTPFTSVETNMYGCNIDVRALLEACDAELITGNPAEIHGFPEFDKDRIQSNLSQYLVGYAYPALAQCLVARKI